MTEPQVTVFTSNGEFIPKGQYLITVWPDAEPEMAFRPGSDWIWSPPIAPSRSDGSRGGAHHG